MLEALGLDVFDLIVAAVAVSLLPLAVDLVNTLFPKAHIGRIAQESVGYMLVCIITSLITSALVLWATTFLPFHMKYFSLSTFPHGVFHVTLGLWLLFHCFYHYAQAIIKGPGRPPKPKRQRRATKKMEDNKATSREEQKSIPPSEGGMITNEEQKSAPPNENDNVPTSEGEKSTRPSASDATTTKEENISTTLNSGSNSETRRGEEITRGEGPDSVVTTIMCKSCKAPKPYRAHHCKICQSCSLVMDHHCPFLGTCVGQDNQRHFILFLVFVSLGDFYATCLSVIPFLSCVLELDSFALNDAELCSMVGRYRYIVSCTIILLIPLFIITMWQLFVVYTNTTTIESMKKAWSTPIHLWPLQYWRDFKKGNSCNFSVFRGKRFGALLL